MENPLSVEKKRENILFTVAKFVHACITGSTSWNGHGDIEVSSEKVYEDGTAKVIVLIHPLSMPPEFRTGPEPFEVQAKRVEDAKAELEAYREDLGKRMNKIMAAEKPEEADWDYCDACESYHHADNPYCVAREDYAEKIAELETTCMGCYEDDNRNVVRARLGNDRVWRCPSCGRPAMDYASQLEVVKQRQSLLLDAVYFVIANMKREDGSVLDQKCKEMMERIEDGKQ